MSIVLLRRRKLGRTSCREIANNMRNPVEVVRNDHPINPDADLCIRWGCTSTVPIRNVLNTSRAIHEVNDKLAFRRKLNEAGLCPRTWFDWRGAQDDGDHEIPFPLIVRPSRHAQGRHLWVCNNPDEVRWNSEDRYGVGNYYISELINKVSEYRVFVVQGRVACVAQKTPGNPDQVAWNVAQGGRFDNVNWDNWPLRAVKASVEAFNLTELDFGGVDVMVDAEGKPYILEINSAPSLTSPYRQQCMAKCFDWIIDNGKDRIPLIEQKGGYRKFIHPAVCERAQLV